MIETVEEYLKRVGPVVPVTDFSNKPDWLQTELSLLGKEVIYGGDIRGKFIGFFEDKEDLYYGLETEDGIEYGSCVGGIKEKDHED